jgi:low temperature requirement protein LtrA
MFAVMAAMLVVGLAAPEAFGSAGIVFGAAYLVVRLLHIALYAVTTRGDPDVFHAVLRLGPGMVVSPLLILAAGFLDAGPVRAGLWIVALTVDYASPLVSGTAGWKMDAGHFAERHGLVVIIALGESLVALGLGASGQELSPGIVVAAGLGVVVVCAMWWLYFDVVAVAAERNLASLTGRAQAALARDAYSYLHLFLVFGVVLVALGLKKTLLHIDEPLDTVPAVALFGGFSVYLGAHIAFRWRNIRTVNEARLLTALLLIALIPVGLHVPALVSLALVAAAVVGLVAFEALRWGDARHQIRHHSGEAS